MTRVALFMLVFVTLITMSHFAAATAINDGSLVGCYVGAVLYLGPDGTTLEYYWYIRTCIMPIRIEGVEVSAER